ncbi:MAG TPA: hypothetical protein VM165_24230 [Planctomycetaceae bacterium]|nr:hypothetical protein [Planctomycetaceae bacterium]
MTPTWGILECMVFGIAAWLLCSPPLDYFTGARIEEPWRWRTFVIAMAVVLTLFVALPRFF